MLREDVTSDRPKQTPVTSHTAASGSMLYRREAAALPPPRRRAGRLPRGRHGTAARAAALEAALASRVGAAGGGAVGPLPARAARPAAAWRLRGPPAPPYTPAWFAEVMAGFCRDVCGPRPLVGGHDAGALILLRAVVTRQLTPGGARADAELDAPSPRARAARADRESGVRGRRRARARPGRLARRAARVPADGRRATSPPAATPPRATSSATRSPGSAATPTAPGVGTRRATWPTDAQGDLLDAYAAASRRRRCSCGPTRTACTRSRSPRRRSTCSRDAQLRVLAGTGFLMAYDNPVGVARELKAFLRVTACPLRFWRDV